MDITYANILSILDVFANTLLWNFGQIFAIIDQTDIQHKRTLVRKYKRKPIRYGFRWLPDWREHIRFYYNSLLFWLSLTDAACHNLRIVCETRQHANYKCWRCSFWYIMIYYMHVYCTIASSCLILTDCVDYIDVHHSIRIINTI